jgi:hypothetical protein
LKEISKFKSFFDLLIGPLGTVYALSLSLSVIPVFNFFPFQSRLHPRKTASGFLAFIILWFFLPLTGLMAQEGNSSIVISATTSRQAEYQVREALLGSDVDGRVNPGEALYLDIRIKNQGTEKVLGLRARLSLAGEEAEQYGEYIRFDKDTADIGDLAPGQFATLSGGASPSASIAFLNSASYSGDSKARGLKNAFIITVADHCPPGIVLPLTVTFADSRGNTWTETLPLPVEADPAARTFSLARFTFSFSPRLMKDGSFTDFSLGYRYARKAAGEVQVRYTDVSKYEPLLPNRDEDSLNVIKDQTTEVFFFPVKYYFIRKPGSNFWIGAGAFYEYEVQTEKGYFTMTELNLLGKEKVNAYNNDFSMHLLGPLLDAGFAWRNPSFYFSLSASVVPVFSFWTKQKMEITPLLEPNYADYERQNKGSPYLYGNLNLILWKYFSFALSYNFFQLNYNVLDFDAVKTTPTDYDFFWITPESTLVFQSLKLETSLLIPLRGITLQVGYGYAMDSQKVDAKLDQMGKHYLIVSGKTINF